MIGEISLSVQQISKRQSMLMLGLSAMKIVQVALPSPLRRCFDYQLPVAMTMPAPGCRVRVPFGRREVVALVVGEAVTTDVPLTKLKPILEVIDSSPLLPETLWRLANWSAQYYQHPLGDALLQMLPVLLRQGETSALSVPQLWRLTPRGQALTGDDLQRAPKQLGAWQILKEHPQGLGERTLVALGAARDSLRALLAKEVVELISQAHVAPTISAVLAEPPLTLSTEQALALTAITQSQSSFQVSLLHGVTGSGKTEVYLQAIASVLAQGRQVLVLVPEIGLTPQTVTRFRARFKCLVVVMHSGLTDRERWQAWREAAHGEAGIVIGTRSAVYVPLLKPGLIVVDEEHDASFKQQEGFRYNARDVAVRRAQLEQIPIVLGSATPSLETLANVAAGRYQRIALTQRAGGAQAPKVSALDIRGQRLQDGLAPAAYRAIDQALAAGGQVLVFLNRRGYAPVLLCHDCGWQADCPRCDAKPTLHQYPTRLHCHHCGHERRPPPSCPDCGSTDLRPMGIGTERLDEALTERYPQVPVLRIDRDSTRRKGSLVAKLDVLQDGKPAILVGTQMLAKGHHLPSVTLVVIPDVDGALFSSDFRGSERLAQLLVQVSGRAGRGELAGRVLLQTHQPEHPLLQVLLQQGFVASARVLLRERELMGLPPYSYMALLRAEATDEQAPLLFLQRARQHLTDMAVACEIWGPVPAPMTRKAGRVRAHLLIKSSQRSTLQQALSALLTELDALPESRRVRWSVDVDPQEMA
jgi:primosomal protein N' (replication factor Y)